MWELFLTSVLIGILVGVSSYLSRLLAYHIYSSSSVLANANQG